MMNKWEFAWFFGALTAKDKVHRFLISMYYIVPDNIFDTPFLALLILYEKLRGYR